MEGHLKGLLEKEFQHNIGGKYVNLLVYVVQTLLETCFITPTT